MKNLLTKNLFAKNFAVFAILLGGVITANASNTSGNITPANGSYANILKLCMNVSCSDFSRINFRPTYTSSSSPITITDSAVTGYAWGDTIGWINFAPSGQGVFVSPTTGRLSGYAWSSVGGWINFSPSSAVSTSTNGPGVWIDSLGNFYGSAYVSGLGGGWINFDCSATSTCVNTDWRYKSLREACQNGIDDDGDSVLDFPGDAGCSSLTDTDETNVSTGGGFVGSAYTLATATLPVFASITPPKPPVATEEPKNIIETIVDNIFGGNEPVVVDREAPVAPSGEANSVTAPKQPTYIPWDENKVLFTRPFSSGDAQANESSEVFAAYYANIMNLGDKPGGSVGINEEVIETFVVDAIRFEITSPNKFPVTVEAVVKSAKPLPGEMTREPMIDDKGVIPDTVDFVKSIGTFILDIVSAIFKGIGNIFVQMMFTTSYAQAKVVSAGDAKEVVGVGDGKYNANVVMPEAPGVYTVLLKTTFNNKAVSYASKTVIVREKGVVYYSPMDIFTTRNMIDGAKLTVEQKQLDGSFVKVAGVDILTNKDGEYGILLTRGVYRFVVDKEGFKKFTTKEFSITENYEAANFPIEMTCSPTNYFGCSIDVKIIALLLIVYFYMRRRNTKSLSGGDAKEKKSISEKEDTKKAKSTFPVKAKKK